MSKTSLALSLAYAVLEQLSHACDAPFTIRSILPYTGLSTRISAAPTKCAVHTHMHPCIQLTLIIRTIRSYAHVFLPILTTSSNTLPTTFPPSPGIQHVPRAHQHKPAGLPCRRQEMTEEVGDHAIRGVLVLGASC
ncbi:hypothetical protein EDB84DRAFT_403799 [Lactarius hengduanensis]|nr:hypothetical protein EDB84DRAFT_403799 [Lactarius hengduanensis]